MKPVGNNLVQTPAGKPFLLEDEKKFPPTPLSFDLIRKAFIKEFSRRFQEHKSKKRKVIEYSIRPMLTPKQRADEFLKTLKKKK